jgi:tripartite ATP-independent transporter DctM subunit
LETKPSQSSKGNPDLAIAHVSSSRQTGTSENGLARQVVGKSSARIIVGASAANRLEQALHTVITGVPTLALLTELAVVVATVIARKFFNISLLWSDEIASLALTTIAFMGAAAGAVRSEHIALHLLDQRLPARWTEVSNSIGEWVVVTVMATVAYLGARLVVLEWPDSTPILHFSQGWYAVPLPLGAVVIALATAIRILRRKAVYTMPAGALVLGVAAFAWSAQGWFGIYLGSSWGWAIAAAVFATLIVIGVPIAFAFLAGSLLLLSLTGLAPLDSVTSQMRYSVDSFVLLALPFFVFAGYLMVQGGLSKQIADLARTWVGHVRGGLYQVVVVSMYLFSGLSGAKVADLAAIGSTMNTMLVQQGYRREQTAAVLAASAAMGETVPPSLVLLIVGSITSLSIGTLFVAGLLPAATVALCLMATIYIQARFFSHSKPAPGVGWSERATITFRALPAIGVPLVLIGGIVFGIATPTEVSSFAVLYAAVLAIVVYRRCNLRGLWRFATDAAVLSGVILLLISSATVVSWILAAGQVPEAIASALGVFTNSQIAFLLISIVLLIVIGAVLEGLPAILLFVPILMPLAVQLGINSYQYALVLIIAQGIGAFAPPIGVGLYVACSICETKPEKAFRPMVPYLAALVVGVCLVALIPWVTLALPRALNLHT